MMRSGELGLRGVISSNRSRRLVVFYVLVACCVSIGVLGWTYSILVGAQAWECRRYARNLAGRPADQSMSNRRVALFVPCKGFDVGLSENLRSLFLQGHRNYEIVFVVENRRDPAYATICRLMAEYPQVPSRCVVAGLACESGQKVHNLLAATGRLSRDVEILAFVDSDARPDPSWLGALIERLKQPGTGAVTGYRWMIPQRNTLANLILYSINSAAAALYGPRGPALIWGGSWAIRRDTFEAGGIREAWRGTLSDDLVATRAVRALGLRIQFEPRCMTRSPLDTTFAGSLEFMRRQFLIGRRYAWPWWLPTFVAQGISQTAFWGSAAVGIASIAGGHWYGWLAMFNFAAMYAGGVYRGWLRQQLVPMPAAGAGDRLTWPRRFDLLVGPLLGLVTVAAMTSACVGNSIVWRGVGYRIGKGGRVAFLGRRHVDQPATDIAIHAAPDPARRAA